MNITLRVSFEIPPSPIRTHFLSDAELPFKLHSGSQVSLFENICQPRLSNGLKKVLPLGGHSPRLV